MSKLIVEVCKVDKIEKHPNADKLSIIQIKGWSCIVGLDQYKEGDLVIYCPPDCVIPNDIIEKYNLEYLKKCGRVGTVKLRKYISQGLVLDMSCLPNPDGDWEGQDVAKELGITKYEPTVSNMPGSGKGKKPTKKKLNPLFDKYTDIDNIKNYNKVFKVGDPVVVTEKIHGTNFRAGRLERYKDSWWGKMKAFLFGKYEFVYGSHNVQFKSYTEKNNFYKDNVYSKMSKKYKLEEVIPENYIIYGEIYGKKIQELEYDMEDIDFKVFDVKYDGEYLDWSGLLVFCVDHDLPVVPILKVGTFDENTVEQYTSGQSTIANHMREGCVIKSLTEEKHPQTGRKMLKSVSAEYLLTKNRTEFH